MKYYKYIYVALTFLDNINDETSKQLEKINNPTSSNVSIKVYCIPY